MIRLSSPEIQQFIRDHAHHDPFQLALQADKYPGLPIKDIAEQLRARQKAKTKLPEWYAHEGIIFPPVLSMEQCSSETTARYKGSLLQGTHLVDLTGGAGADTYYMSQSFEHTDYVEQQPHLAETARHNFAKLQASRITVHAGAAAQFVEALPAPVTCIYLDPARRNEHTHKVFQLEDCSPDVVQLQEALLAKAQHVLIKTSPMLDIEAAVRVLNNVHQVHVVAVQNECKEVIYWLAPDAGDTFEIVTVNFQQPQPQFFRFCKEQEVTASVSFSAPQQYLYEPNAALLKAGAFKVVAQAYRLHKLHLHTHLYTSEHRIPDFPGRVFECQAVVPYQKKAVNRALPSAKAHLTTRNFPVSVPVARKKLGLSDGGDYYLFLTTFHEKPQVVVTKMAKH